MNDREIGERLSGLTTALVADALLRAKETLRIVPSGLRPASGRTKAAGRVMPARHAGSVDVFIEAIGKAAPGDVLVIDNQGRRDEACIGDLIALEAQAAGLSGILVWGFHRDTAELQEIPLAVFSYGSCPAGPVRLEPVVDASPLLFGEAPFSCTDFVLADSDGAVFVAEGAVEKVLDLAASISATERRQAETIRGGTPLFAQLRFEEYLAERARDPSYTFRRHLQRIGGAIEV